MGLITAARIMVLVLAAVCFAPAVVMAQRDLPDEIVTAPNLSPGQVSEIRAFITQQLTEFESADPEVSRRGRQAIVRAYGNVAVSPAYRNTSSEVLTPRLVAIAEDQGRPELAVVAVQMLGNIATERSIEALDRFVRDEREVMRYAAAQAMARTVRAVQTSAPAVGPDRVLWIVDRFRDGLSRENDAVVAYMHVRGLIAAAVRDQPSALASVRPRALLSLATVCGERLQKLGNSDADKALVATFIGAAEYLRQVLAEDIFARSLPRDFVLACAGLGGDMLAFVNRQVRMGASGMFALTDAGGPEDIAEAKRRLRQSAVALTALGETIVFLCKDALEAGQPVPAPNLARHLEAANAQGDAAFIRDVRGVFEMLTRPPFSFPAGRFLN